MAATAMAGQQIEMMGARRQTAGRVESLAERNRELFEAQRKARRGPTPEVFFAKHIDNTRLVKADDLSRIDAAFFTMNGYVSVIFFVFWATDIFLR